jgi:hypothetical protein
MKYLLDVNTVAPATAGTTGMLGSTLGAGAEADIAGPATSPASTTPSNELVLSFLQVRGETNLICTSSLMLPEKSFLIENISYQTATGKLPRQGIACSVIDAHDYQGNSALRPSSKGIWLEQDRFGILDRTRSPTKRTTHKLSEPVLHPEQGAYLSHLPVRCRSLLLLRALIPLDPEAVVIMAGSVSGGTATAGGEGGRDEKE